MDSCCDEKLPGLSPSQKEQSRTLKIVLAINLLMFFVEAAFGMRDRSTALLSDSLDMLGDALIYGFSLYVISRGLVWAARASLAKGILMLIFGIGVFIEAGTKIFAGVVPVAATMGVIGLLALTANTVCALLLLRRRNDDINMRSVWLCTRNDVIANLGVLIGAAGVGITQSAWPDILVGILIASLVLKSGWTIVQESRRLLIRG